MIKPLEKLQKENRVVFELLFAFVMNSASCNLFSTIRRFIKDLADACEVKGAWAVDVNDLFTFVRYENLVFVKPRVFRGEDCSLLLEGLPRGLIFEPKSSGDFDRSGEKKNEMFTVGFLRCQPEEEKETAIA